MKEASQSAVDGIWWTAQIPDGWQAVPLKWLVTMRSGDQITSDDIGDSGSYPVYGGNGLRGYTRRYTHDGSYVLIGRQGALCGNINYAEGKFFASEHAIVVSARTDVPTIWLGETLRAMNLGQYSFTAAQPGLSVDTIKNLKIPVPPPERRAAIAEFLKKEATGSNMLTREYEALVRLVEEKRISLVAHLTINGLDPKVRMRESGIPWIGMLPKHWKVIRNKVLFNERNERSESGGEELLSVSHLTGVAPRSEKNVTMFMAESLEGYKKCYKGDLVVNTMWAWMGAMGTSPCDGIASPSYNVYEIVDKNVLDPSYYDLVSRTPNHIAMVKSASSGVWESRLRLYPDEFFNLYTPIPPLEEQQAIVDQVRSEERQFDALAQISVQTKKLLEERHAVVSLAAVSGEIDVTSYRSHFEKGAA